MLGQVLGSAKLPNLSKISKMKSKVVRAEKSDVVQWGEGHLFWVMVVLATIAVIALVYLLYKIRKKRLQNAPAADLDVKPKTLGLRKTWRNFKKALPSRYRASAKLFRSFYVFGASGSGKTTIIDESIHWRGQERQYRHSETRNPNLQIYHGATQFVFEFGGKVLEDTTARVRKELKRFWRGQRHVSEPVFYYVVSAEALLNESVERVVKNVQFARGKYNALCALLGQPVEFGIIVTHLDTCEGYQEFQTGLGENNVRLTLQLSWEQTVGSLAEQLSKYEVYLPYLMQTVSPEDYVKAAGFIQDSQPLLTRLQILVDELKSQDPTSFDVRFGTAYFSSRDDTNAAANSPFEVQLQQSDVLARHPYRFHIRTASAIGLLGLIYLSAGYWYEQRTIKGAERILERAMAGNADEFSYYVQKEFYDYLERRRHSFLSDLLVDFSPNHDVFLHQEIRDDYIASVENKLLLPEIKKLLNAVTGADMERYLYLSGLAAATSTNELGAFVLKHSAVWARVTGLNELLIRDYVTHHSNTRYISPDLTRLMSRDAVRKILELEGEIDWTTFLETVQSWKGRIRILNSELTEIKAQTDLIRQAIGALKKHDVTLQFMVLLDPKDRLDIGPHWKLEIERGKAAQRGDLKRLLDVIGGSTLAKPATLDTSLSSIIEFAKSLKPQSEKGTGLNIRLLGQSYSFDLVDWHRLVQRSSLIAIVNDYQTQAWSGSPWRKVLFGRSSKFKPIELNRIPGEDQLFSGTSKIHGFFTKEAFQSEVAPLLNKLQDDLKTLSLPQKEEEDFIAFIDETLSSYAKEYTQAYTQYYEAHKLRRFSRQLLPFVAREIGSVNSPLLGLLKCIRDNTAFDIDDANRFFAAFDEIRYEFQSLTQIIGKNPAKSPSWLAYQKLVYDLSLSIANTAPNKPTKEAYLGELATALSPLGLGAVKTLYRSQSAAQIGLEEWLRSANVRQEWQGPFRDIFDRSLRIGVEEVEGYVRNEWSRLRGLYYAPLVNQFPFARHSRDVVDISTLKAALHPKGEFWSNFEGKIKPLLKHSRAGWKARTSEQVRVTLPASLIETANRLNQIRALLWDDKGKEKAIRFSIRALPFPQTDTQAQPVMAALQIGGKSVFAFNQQPQWQTIDIEWWAPETARLSVGFERYGQANRTYASVAAGGEQWSFFRLLQQATRTEADPDIWFWTVSGGEDDLPPTSVLFRFKHDPLEDFALEMGGQVAR